MPTLPEQRSRAANWWRWVFIAVWMTAIVAGLAYYATHAERFTPEHLAADLRRWERLALLVYLAASVSRALVLIPSTPFVLAGCLLFPDSPWLVLGTSMLAIALSASLLYYGAEHLGLDAYFKRRHPAGIAKLEAMLRSRGGFWALAAWACFPVAPTDLACYVAGTLRLPFWRFLAALCLGESVVCAFYVFSGRLAWQGLTGN